MYFDPYGNAPPKIPFRTKVGLIVGAIAVLSLLAIFAFTFFLVALSVGAVAFVLNLFRGPVIRRKADFPPSRPYQHPPRAKDDDVIDV